MIEYVRGTVIGELTQRVALVSPKGGMIRATSLCLNDDPAAWGEVELEEIKNQKCGDGKTLFSHLDIFEDIYCKGKWTVRIYE